MKIAILDDYQGAVRQLSCFERLSSHEVLILDRHYEDPKTLAALLGGVEVLIPIRERTWIHEPLLSGLPHLRYIIQTGKAGRHLDAEYCKSHAIQVFETEGTSIATAEFTILMILASLRNFGREISNMKEGLWQKSLGRQLHGLTLSILGLGKIGEQVARVAHVMGAKILVWGRDQSMNKAKALGWEVAQSRADFFARADVLSITLRLTDQTLSYVTAEDLALMKTNAILVNTARAELIEPQALLEALRLGRPGFAAVDVYEHEPVLNAQHPLQELSNCLCSPHLGFAEKENFENYMSQAIDWVEKIEASRKTQHY